MNHDTFLPFSRPFINEAMIQEVVDCLKSGWLATGPRVQKFTELLKEYLQAQHVLPLVNGTAGLHLALMSLDLQPGDEVITTPMTFVASVNTIVIAGGKPVFVDVEPDSYNIDTTKIESAITPRTRAILPVHYAGLSVDLDPIYKLAERYHLRVIEDAAHAIGTEYKGKKIGSFGDTQLFSFHPNKNLTTGEGGCITTSQEKTARFISIYRFHGIDREAWNRFSKQGSQHYDVIGAGFKYNMSDIQASLGIHQLQALDSMNARRAALAERYLSLLSDWPEWQLPAHQKSYEQKHSWHLFVPLLNPESAGMDRDTFMEKMKIYNIGTGFHYDAVHLFSFYRNQFGYKPGDFPHAESIAKRIVSLPLFPSMKDEEQDRVIDAMKQVFKR